MSCWIHVVSVGLKVTEGMWVVHTALPTHILNNREHGKVEDVTDIKD
jgi:hypothetical protein